MQKLKDLQLAISGSRKAKFFIVAGALMVLFLIFKKDGPQIGRFTRQKPPVVIATGKVAQGEAAGDLMTTVTQELQKLKVDNDNAKRDLADNKEQLKQYEERTAEILKKMLERMAENQTAPAASVNVGATDPGSADYASNTAPNYGNGSGMQNAGGGLAQDDSTLESFGLAEPEVAPPPPPAVKKIAFIGTGDSVRVKLLAGVNAPTDGTPYPVVFKLVSDIYGPDGSVLPLGEARLVAAAQGSLTDSRALFRLTSLNIRLPNGERKVFNVDGWIVGEDGIRGMQGALIDPIGKAIGGAAFAGALQGIGQGLSSANTSTTNSGFGLASTVVDGDLGEYAAGKGLTSAAKEWSSIIKDRLSELVPVVQVLSNREGTAVFAKNLAVEGLYEAMEADEDNKSTLD